VEAPSLFREAVLGLVYSNLLSSVSVAGLQMIVTLKFLSTRGNDIPQVQFGQDVQQVL